VCPEGSPLDVPLWLWIVTLAGAALFLAFDVVWLVRHAHVPSTKEVSLILGGYVSAAVLFALGIWYFAGSQYAGEFVAGWLTEYSLSVDNLFIFILIMSRFSVPRQYQQSTLMIGIVIAIVLRAVFIAAGAAAINAFAWVFYLFAAILVWTAFNLIREGAGHEGEYEENRLMRWVERRFPATQEWNGMRLMTIQNGKRLVTPMFIVILALGTTDLLFALDSIPAIYGLTKEPYLVLTANLFALMGLRQLYFLLGGLLQKLVYLNIGLAVLLFFIGVKLLLHALHENDVPFINGGQPVPVPEVPIAVSLGAIVVILGVTTVASLWRTGKDDRAEARR
jgi:tellurite resistance protein TerC